MIGGQSKRNEVDKYLKEDCEDLENENFDILDWWKVNSHKYRMLSRIARDVLASHVSTVALESTFSTGSHILDPFRSSLAHKMVKALICSKNWLSNKRELMIKLDYADKLESYKDSCEAISDERSYTTTVVND